MKRASILSGLLLMIALPLMAEHVDPETARKVATTFLSNNGVKTVQLVDLSKEAGFDNLYIFNANPGFVVIAADDCAKPILGYSLTDSFIVNDLPENMKWWLQQYNGEIQYAIDSRLSANAEIAQRWKNLKEGKDGVERVEVIVGPLIQTQWAQSSPFNDLCPSGTITGCVATAMAQVMKYWNYPPKGIGSYSYNWNGQNLSADFGNTTYDWNNMTNTYGNSSTNDEKSAVATLMFHCGVSVNMYYGPSASSSATQDAATALIKYFNYSKDIIYLSKNDYPEEWIDTLKYDLNRNMPIQYAGNGTGGHSFVCDGYDSENNFHFNWGWGNSYLDTYFPIDGLTPGSSNYSNNQSAILNIHPSTIGEAAAPTLTSNINGRDVQLGWNKVDNATAYQVYRNTTLVYTTDSGEEVSYFDSHIPFGTHVYYVRSVDAAGYLSWPSNYVTESAVFAGPTLTAVSSSEGIQLSWTPCEDAETYTITCNGVLIAQDLNTTTFLDTRSIAGTLTYYVKGKNDQGEESSPSNTIVLNIPFRTPISSNLTATLTENNAAFSWAAPNWCFPQNESSMLTYGSGNYGAYTGSDGTDNMYWGHRYLPSDLTSASGKVIYRVSFYVREPGLYELQIYQGTTLNEIEEESYEIPASLLRKEIVITTQRGWFTIDLGEPIPVDVTQDLWIYMYDPEKKNRPIELCLFSDHTKGCYYSTDLTTWTNTYNGCAWLIRTYLTDGTYTYNLYDGTTKVNGNDPITATSYTVENITSGIHQYTVKTNYYGGESGASNKAGITIGENSLATLNLDENADKMTVTSGSVLTVGTITNTDPANLIIEDGAQLINESTGVKATVKKNVTAYTSGADGWNFIASPVTETLSASEITGLITTDTYDFYYLDEGSEKWINYKDNDQHTNTDPGFNIQSKKGYLYANSANNTIDFEGTLQQDGSVSLTKTNNGWNLIGNPFTCNAYASQSFYSIVNGALDANLKDNTTPIPPCTGILVKAASDKAAFTFSKTAPVASTNNGNLKIALAQATTTRTGTHAETLDKAIVSFNEGSELGKFYLGLQNANIYIPQNGEEYTIAYSKQQGEMPLCFKANHDGEYTITVNAEDVKMDYLHLIDNIASKDVDLIATPSYTFSANADDCESRFRLMFSTSGFNPEKDDNFAFISDGNIFIFTDDVFSASLQVIDMTGRVVMQKDDAHIVSTDGITPGVYVLRLATENQIKTQKIIIN